MSIIALMVDSAIAAPPVSPRPPFRCAICGLTEPFSAHEHIVPESLGNDLVVLAPGWICDPCNNICSAFESRALSRSILGIERCRLGVMTKKRKPATAQLHGVSWFAEPSAPESVLSAEADWSQIPVLETPDGMAGKIAVPLHDESNDDICRLLLKIGVELLAVVAESSGIRSDVSSAAEVILGKNTEPWPYFILRTGCAPSQLVSVFESTPEAHEYVRACGFDLFLHEVEAHKVVVFEYGHFLAAASLFSRNTDWTWVLSHWNVSYVGCPIEFAALRG